jgi:hypothetical protein
MRAPVAIPVAPAQAEPAARNREQRDADDAAMDVVQRALATRVWTRDDVVRVRHQRR